MISSAKPDAIASMLAAPVAVDRIALSIRCQLWFRDGSVLRFSSIWVGAIILVAMLKVSISDHERGSYLRVGAMICRSVRKWVFARAMIAGRIAGPAAALDVLKKPRARAPRQCAAVRFTLAPRIFRPIHDFRFPCFAARYAGGCLGDMFYLGVQCEHPIQFLMVGWLSALVFLEYCVYADPVVR